MSFKRGGVLATLAAAVVFGTQSAGRGSAQLLPDPPQVRSTHGAATLLLTAAETSDGRASMQYNGSHTLPTIRVWPGDRMRITYVNRLSAHSTERCALGPCKDMTNLHFHGMEVSPRAPQDDVLSMMAPPGTTLYYDVRVPENHLPGLYWIHTHPHGESAEQDLDGMSLAVVVDGIDRYVPQVRGLRERVMVVRTLDPPASQVENLRRFTDVPRRDCGTSGEQAEDFPTVNGAVRPTIAIAPGERQFWRIVNAQPESFLDLRIEGTSFQVVALDGQPLAYRNPAHPIETMKHVFLPPAGRVEAIVMGPPAGAHATLKTQCVNTGPAGDINAGGVLADIAPHAPQSPMESVPLSSQPPVYKPVDVSAVEKAAPQFTVRFTEGHHRFYINGKIFTMDAKPMVTVHIGSFQRWHVINKTNEMHPFHIHQVHFLTYALNGHAISNAVWSDTMNLPPKSSIDTVMDFTDPVIRGIAVFHCHILSHEDKGMMAKVDFK
jgi:suppressor of ftsI